MLKHSCDQALAQGDRGGIFFYSNKGPAKWRLDHDDGMLGTEISFCPYCGVKLMDVEGLRSGDIRQSGRAGKPATDQ